MFVCRVLNDSLPTASWLENRGLLSSPVCLSCGYSEEQLIHVLRDCSRVKRTWLSFLPDLVTEDFFMQDLQVWILNNMQSTVFLEGIPWGTIFIHALWYFWYWRNLSIFYGKFSWPYDAKQLIWTKAKEAWDSLQCDQQKVKHESLIDWMKPKEFFVKLNVDGSA